MPELVTQIQEQRGIEGVRKWLDSVPYTATEDGSLGYHEGAVAALGQLMLDAMKAEMKAAKDAREQAAAHGVAQAGEIGELRAVDAHRHHHGVGMVGDHARAFIDLHQRAGDGDSPLGKDHAVAA